MSNSSRIEAATRDHVGAVLTGAQITELVRHADPNWKGGIYPSDAAYKRTEQGLQPRGKTAYGDGVLEYLSENSFKVLATEQIVRRPTSKKAAVKAEVKTEAKPEAAPVVAAPVAGKKEAAKVPSSIPVAPRKKARDVHAAQ